MDRPVNFITIFKVESITTGQTTQDKHVIKKHRLFFKDFDGALLEVKQPKIMIKKHELHKLMSLINKKEKMVTGHGEYTEDRIAEAIKETEQHIFERENPHLK